MNILEDDINKLILNMKERQDSVHYYSYIKNPKNLIYCNDESNKIINDKKSILFRQKAKEKIIEEELDLFDSFGIEIIGIKGPFIKDEYYGEIPRVYNDLDLLVRSDDAKYFYEKLKNCGYKIKSKTFYDNPIINMKLLPKLYMENTQTLMLYNKEKGVSIDLHSNLNITNAHFTKTTTKFSTEEFFENSKQFKSFSNIKQLDIYDNLCYIIRHLLKHHIFYGKTQIGLKTFIQHIMDFAVIVNSENFSEKHFIERIIKYNLSAESVFCINLYNSIFLNCRIIGIEEFYKIYKSIEKSCKWRSILETSLNMDITDLMIGNFCFDFPILYHCVEFCQNIKNKKLGWFLQALIVNPFALKYISSK